mgnify:CR=1 FL=1
MKGFVGGIHLVTRMGDLIVDRHYHSSDQGKVICRPYNTFCLKHSPALGEHNYANNQNTRSSGLGAGPTIEY